jgi:predicted permease
VGGNLKQDVAYSLRMLRQSPLFTAVAVTSLALGIGANTAIFTLVDAILLRWLPVKNPQELVILARNPSQPITNSSYPDYCYLRDHSRSYAGLIAFWSGGVTRFGLPGENGSSQLVALALVSGNYFETLGVPPALGRMFNPGDNERQGAHPYVILGHAFWKRAFGGDTSVIGRDILLNGARWQVVGVAREGFAGATVGVAPDVFAPIIMERSFWPNDIRALTDRAGGWVTMMGRLKPGVSRTQAEAELNVLWRQILEGDPKQRVLINTRLLLAGSSGNSPLRNQASRPLAILMITSGFVLLIACANVASLLLARAVARRKEIAVRLAVGAKRSRLVMQMLTESLTLSVIGGMAGLALAWVGVKSLLRFLPHGASSPLEISLSPDVRLLAFAFIVTVISGVAFGLAPALQASRPDLIQALKSDAAFSRIGRSTRWDLGRTLVSLQVTISLLLLAGAGLFGRTLSNLRSLDSGMDRERLLFIETNMIQTGYQPQRARSFYERLRDEAQRLPGVRAASAASTVPFGDGRSRDEVQIEGYQWTSDELRIVDMNIVAPRYFEVAGIPIVRGRDFRSSDKPAVAIVNEAFAHHFFGGGSAIGRRLCLGEKWDAARAYEIVGIAADAHYSNLRQGVEPMIYLPPYRENEWGGGILCIRTAGDPKQIIGAIRRTVQEIDPAVMITETRTMEANLNRALLQERFVATLGGFFGAVALLLAAVGLYGVTSQAVTRRTREIGIRMALGAQSRQVLWMALRDALTMVGIGAMVGVLAVLALLRYTASLLFGVEPQDPITIAAAASLIFAVTALAGFLPALRATRVQPIAALRQE